MRRTIALLAAGLVGAASIAAGPSSSRAAADHEAELAIGESVTVQGDQGVGTNANYFTDFTCSSDPHTYCQSVLIKLTNPYEEENAKKGRERATLDMLFTPTSPANDFDLMLFSSDADGNQGDEIGRSGSTPVADCESGCEQIAASITTTEDETEVWVLAQVVYFAAYGDWTLDLDFQN